MFNETTGEKSLRCDLRHKSGECDEEREVKEEKKGNIECMFDDEKDGMEEEKKSDNEARMTTNDDKNEMYTGVQFNGVRVLALVDTGSDTKSMVRHDFLQCLNLEFDTNDVSELRQFGNRGSRTLDRTRQSVIFFDTLFMTTLNVENDDDVPMHLAIK